MFICLQTFIATKFSNQALNNQNNQVIWNLSESDDFSCDSNCPSSIKLTGISQECFVSISGNTEDEITLYFDNINLTGYLIINQIKLNIILIGNNYIYGLGNEYSGIECAGHGRIIISSIEGDEGNLTVDHHFSNYGSGIGSTSTCEEIRIDGGKIEAIGGIYAAGIGVGASWSEASIGTITINGGTINAIGGEFGAGIGGGNGLSDSTSYVESIILNNGIINAIGGEKGAGIGGGSSSYVDSSWVGSIKINNGIINAIGGEFGAGIGGGRSYDGYVWYGYNISFVGSIEINGGTINAIGGQSGIGGGFSDCSYSSYVKSININGGTINATGGHSGIGGGNSSKVLSSSSIDSININGGTIIATGVESGIGGGYNSEVFNLFIGNKVTYLFFNGSSAIDIIGNNGRSNSDNVSISVHLNFMDNNQTCWYAFCQAGAYEVEDEYGMCKLCQSGTYSEEGSSECTKCLAGTYSEEGSSECTKCLAGTYSEEEGANSSLTCKICPEGTYSEEGSSKCIKNNSKKLSKGATIGIVIGCIGFIAILVIIVILSKGKKNKQNDNDKDLITV